MSSRDKGPGGPGAARRPRPSAEQPGAPAAPHDDVVLVHGRTDDGKGLEVLRKRGETLAAGEIRPLEEGKPVSGEIVSLAKREDSPFLFDVNVLHAPPAGRKGPAQIATESYREGWQAVFGEAKPKGRAPRPSDASAPEEAARAVPRAKAPRAPGPGPSKKMLN